MTTIAEQANHVKAASGLPAEVVAVFASDQAALAAGGIPTGAAAVGDQITAFTLPDATGKLRTLDELTVDGPAVIVFYRGGWCPYCNLTLRTYERDLLPQLSGHSARLVAISPETPDASLSTQEKDELTYTVLSDAGAQLADALGITFDPSEEGLVAQRALGVDIRTTREDGGTRLPMPTVLIVDRDHILRFVDIHPDYTGRTEVSDILAGLRTLPPSDPTYRATGRSTPTRRSPRSTHTARGRSAIADGRRTIERRIAESLVLTVGAVEKHIQSILSKLDLQQSATDHRRVPAVLAYLQQSD